MFLLLDPRSLPKCSRHSIRHSRLPSLPSSFKEISCIRMLLSVHHHPDSSSDHLKCKVFSDFPLGLLMFFCYSSVISLFAALVCEEKSSIVLLLSSCYCFSRDRYVWQVVWICLSLCHDFPSPPWSQPAFPWFHPKVEASALPHVQRLPLSLPLNDIVYQVQLASLPPCLSVVALSHRAQLFFLSLTVTLNRLIPVSRLYSIYHI